MKYHKFTLRNKNYSCFRNLFLRSIIIKNIRETIEDITYAIAIPTTPNEFPIINTDTRKLKRYKITLINIIFECSFPNNLEI